MTNKVIQGTYADFKIIKSRNVAQFIVEIPIEQAESAIRMFGVPQPQTEKWVAIAQIREESKERNDAAYNAVKSAAMLCNTQAFGQFLFNKYGMDCVDGTPEQTVDALRKLLGITSRSELHENPEALTAFERIKGEYHAWMMN